MSEKKPEVLFLDVGEEAPSEIESMCMACGENGITKILLTRIPHFKEVILMAFECPHCGLRNNEIQSGQSIAEKGLVARCSIKNAKDMNRQLVRSEFATVVIPEIDFESPPTARNGSLTTIEGILQKVYDGLSAEQPIRKYDSPEEYEKIEAFLVRLNQLKELEVPFTVEVRDPSGNSYLENLCAPKEDPQIVVTHYERSEAENEYLGLAKPALEGDDEEPPRDAIDEIRDSVMEFPSNCSNCNVPVICKMHMIDIPFFKDVIIMATACDNCGFKSSEVKSGGAISPKGKKITLKVTDKDDLSRDILKSESCSIVIPEIELELTPGTLGGRFTTVEGLLQQVYDQMEERNPFHYGDSAPKGENPLDKFLAKLKTVIQADIPFTLIMDDCLGSSYLQNLYAPDPDPNMTIEEYERTWEQNDDWGLNDLIENPENPEEPEEEAK